MATPAPNRYDQVLYLSFPQDQTHPDRLSTLARLFGLETAPVERCRVLEIGCGTGGNLWGMAASLPESEFVGIDLAARPIEIGRAAAAEMGLKNLDLRVMDLMEVGPDFGQFDFIISHGVYAWVPDFVRDKVMAVSKASLAPNGVAYISYNAYPGCHMRRMLREMMQWHTRTMADPLERAQQGKALLEFVASSMPEPDAYRALMKKEVEGINKTGDWLLCHDELGDIYEPVWFWQFAGHAAEHGLQFLAEAEFAEMQSGIFSPETMETLSQLGGDVIAREQYSDFLKCRKFRQSLLCHADIELERQTSTAIVPGFSFCAPVTCPSAEPSIRSAQPETFQAHGGKASVTTPNPLAKAALWHLGRVFPRVLTFAELLAEVREILNPGAVHDGSPEDLAGERKVRSALAEILLRTFAANLVEFHVHRPRLAVDPGERPEAFSVARWQLRSDRRITTVRHGSLEVDDNLTKTLLQLADGRHTRAEITAELARISGAAVEDLAPQVDANLAKLGRQALFVA